MNYPWAYRYLRKRLRQRIDYNVAILQDKTYTLTTIDDIALKFSYFTPYHHARAEEYASGHAEEMPLMLDWIKYARDAHVIFDVGGFCGLYGLLAKAANPNAEVYIFEPDEVNVYHIRNNARINGLDIKLIPKAVTDHEGTILFSGDGSTGSRVASWGEPTPCTMLAKYGQPDLMKIDIEGHEREALRGADLSRMKYLFVEMNHPLSIPAREIKRVNLNAIYQFL